MGLSTKDLVESTGGGLPKTISPGNHELKINKVYIEPFKYIDGAYHLYLDVETQPIENFEGFMIDKDDASKGHYAGQVGRIKASQYAFADGETKTGIKIQRDKSILIFLQTLCKALGVNDWFVNQDNKYSIIEDFIAGFNNEAPFKDKYLKFCIAGKEYLNKAGYTSYDMWLPKSSKEGYAFSSIDDNKTMIYNEAIHLTKLEVKPVESFGDDLEISPRSASDFSLD
jgi:hypothetical protein